MNCEITPSKREWNLTMFGIIATLSVPTLLVAILIATYQQV